MEENLSVREKFIIIVDELFKQNDYDEELKNYWEQLKKNPTNRTKNITKLGKKIIKCMQDKNKVSEKKFLIAKEIAEELFVSSKTISGAMSKLFKDGYVEKVGGNPINYCLTEKGLKEEIVEE